MALIYYCDLVQKEAEHTKGNNVRKYIHIFYFKRKVSTYVISKFIFCVTIAKILYLNGTK